MDDRRGPTRTQRERTNATRAALVDATLDLLAERGWAATTSVAACERAGLTRGALVHHFGDLPTLLADALEAHYARLSAEIADEAAPTSLADLVETTWTVIERGRFKIVIEAWLAAANDPELGRAIGPVVTRFAKLVDPAERRDLAPDDATRALYLTAREAMLGLALGRATAQGPLPHERIVVDQLIELARIHDERRGGTP
ncbi:TetR/AcrR family transcriptional regulator [Ilumatobacter fluminis]|uniref:TetR/AcrR family transcriptional regulator n=1 Tax=Ilumatobacter fluminis TaxID=467091 RepID=UPI001AAF3E83|nr:TetR/AcrR family transcriptional regulator [Ilumatobacter fluminis]